MRPSPPLTKTTHRLLWILQLLMATTLLWAAGMKLMQSPEHLSAMWPWTGEVPAWLVKLTGLADLLIALGLVLPGLLGVRPNLTALSAGSLVLLMTAASAFHILRGEASQIGFNIMLAILAGIVLWGRRPRSPR